MSERADAPLLRDHKQGYGVESLHDPIASLKSADQRGLVPSPTSDPPPVSFRGLFRFATCLDRFLILVGTLAALINGVALPSFSIVFGEIINSFGREDILEQVTKFAVYLLIVAAGTFVCSALQVSCWMIVSERQVKRIREAYLRSLVRQDIGWFDYHSPGKLSARLAGDTKLIHEAIGEKVGNYTQLMSTFLSGLTIGLVKGWQLALIILSIAPVLALAGGIVTRIMSQMTKKGMESYAEANGVAEEALSSIRTVASFSAEKRLVERYTESLHDALRAGIRKGKLTGMSLGFTMFILFSSYALSLWYGSTLIAAGSINSFTGKPWTAGDVITVFFSVLMGAMAVGQASPNLANFAAGKGAAAFPFMVIDRQSPIDPLSRGGCRLDPNNFQGHIKFEKLSFRYPTRPDAHVFEGFDLEIEAGTTVALVGQSGSGKSTIVQLLLRFYNPHHGTIKVDGVDISELNVKWWRQQVGVVSQEPVLFRCSVKDNIRRGRPNATDEEVFEAARAANAHEFINDLPLRYDTMVDSHQLSGGQKQRIAIARAILKKPKILLLDEATSALDTHSETEVQEALDKLMGGGMTTIVIAHRLSTVRRADRVVVMREGRVVEQGAHDALLASKTSIFRMLVEAQRVQESKSKAEVQEEEIVRRISSRLISGKSSKRSLIGEKEIEEKVREGGEEGEKEGEAEDGTIVESAPNPTISWRRIMRINRPECGYILLGAIMSFLHGIVFPAFSFIFSNMITVLTQPDVKKGALRYAIFFLALAGYMMFVISIQVYAFTKSGEWLTLRLRQLCFASMIRQEVGWFDMPKHAPGVLLNRLSTDAELIHGVTTDRLGQLIQLLTMLAAGLGIAFYHGPELAAVVLCMAPLIVIAGTIHMRFVAGFSTKAKLHFEKAANVATEALVNIRTLASFTGEDLMLDRFNEIMDDNHSSALKSAVVSGIGFGFSNAIMFAAYALSFWYGADLVQEGKMTLDKVLKVFFAITLSAMGVGQTSSLAPDYKKAQLAANDVFAIIDEVPEINSSSQEGAMIELEEGANIDFKNLGFAYPTRPDIKVFSSLNLTVPGGRTVALVGASGSGKSSLIALLERWYDPTRGSVEVSGVNVRDMNVRCLRSQLGLVEQEPVLFQGTVEENIRMGKPEASLDQIHSAAKQANAHDFIMALPGNYSTMVGNRGKLLSGGQKQRVAIARAILRDPAILLLDEATSALDSESEKLVQAALDNLMKSRHHSAPASTDPDKDKVEEDEGDETNGDNSGSSGGSGIGSGGTSSSTKIGGAKTTIVIAHRLSTIRNADIIVVLNKGAVAEMGTHEELMKAGGIYNKLVKIQDGHR